MDNQRGLSLIVIVLIIITLFAGGIFTWRYFEAPGEEVEVPEEKIKEVAPEGIVEDETANWKTFQSSAMGGFSMKYPRGFTVEDTEEEDRLDVPACPEGYYIQFFSPEQIQLKGGSEAALEVRMNVCSKVGWPGSFSEWVDMLKQGLPSMLEENITLGNRPAIKSSRVVLHKEHLGTPDYKEKLIHIFAYNEEEKWGLEMAVSINFERRNTYLLIFNQMLSTFRFLE